MTSSVCQLLLRRAASSRPQCCPKQQQPQAWTRAIQTSACALTNGEKKEGEFTLCAHELSTENNSTSNWAAADVKNTRSRTITEVTHPELNQFSVG